MVCTRALQRSPSLWLSASRLCRQAPSKPRRSALARPISAAWSPGRDGPEAGVWVIAETTDLPTRMIKSVVTDDQGRYVIPDLPKANYEVWARGYGLVDSRQDHERARQDRQHHRRAARRTRPPRPSIIRRSTGMRCSRFRTRACSPAPGRTATACHRDEDPGAVARPGQDQRLLWLPPARQQGDAHHPEGTRHLQELGRGLGAAHPVRPGDGQHGRRASAAQDTKHAIANFANWTDRIAAGELPFAKPRAAARRRAQHRRHPVGLGRSQGLSARPGLDRQAQADRQCLWQDLRRHRGRARNTSRCSIRRTIAPTTVKMPVRDPKWPSTKSDTMAPSPYWGDEAIWDSQTSTHNPMMDEKGDVWFTSRVGKPDQPGLLQAGIGPSFGEGVPDQGSPTRHLAVYDPKTGKTKLIRTCFSTHHLVFAEDANNTLWISAGGAAQGVIGWLNRKMYEETGDEAEGPGLDPDRHRHQRQRQARRLCRAEPAGRSRPRTSASTPASMVSASTRPTARSGARCWAIPGYIVRVDPGSDPSKTALAEIYEPPSPGYGPRGFDIDRNGVAYVPLSSGHMGAFDRRKCKGPLNGPQAAEGKLCPEGWTLYRRSRARNSATWRRPAAPRRATTPGSTSSTPSASVTTSRWRPAMPTNRCWRWSTASGSTCACRIRSASSPSGWTAASTTRMPAGRAAACGRPTATGRRSTRNRQGNAAQDGQVPGPSRSARAVRQRSGPDGCFGRRAFRPGVFFAPQSECRRPVAWAFCPRTDARYAKRYSGATLRSCVADRAGGETPNHRAPGGRGRRACGETRFGQARAYHQVVAHTARHHQIARNDPQLPPFPGSPSTM